MCCIFGAVFTYFLTPSHYSTALPPHSIVLIVQKLERRVGLSSHYLGLAQMAEADDLCLASCVCDLEILINKVPF